MKINQEMASQLDTGVKKPQKASNSHTSFQAQIRASSDDIKQQEIHQLLKDITVQGDKLSRFRSFTDLAKFKSMVKQFLKETIPQALELKHDHSFSRHGNSQSLTLVKQVNDKLVSLTEDIMDQEKKTVDLLDTVGEIKGLLINLTV